MLLQRNLHPIDQALRVTLGFILIYLGFLTREIISDPIFAMMVGVFGIVNLLSGMVGCCPLYILAGINTSKTITPGHH